MTDGVVHPHPSYRYYMKHDGWGGVSYIYRNDGWGGHSYNIGHDGWGGHSYNIGMTDGVVLHIL